MNLFSLNPYTFRIFLFWGFVNLLSAYGTYLYYEYLSFRTIDTLDLFLLFFFSILFLHLSYGFCIALFGFILEWRGGDPLACKIDPKELDAVNLEKTPVAVVIPIYNEDTSAVYERISKMYLEITKEHGTQGFDFFILSDTNKISVWIKEEKSYIDLLKETNGSGRIYYRRRKINTNGKSGNISDFCRRFGKNYRYMIVLDADSYMTGKGMSLLAKKMETETSIGILQTNPIIHRTETFFQKIFQKSQSLYSKYYLTGANYWQLYSASFWGHNAIIRLEPFIEHCALPKLPKLGAIGGKILSHDTIEAALMRRSGYTVRFSLDDLGSFEEYPPSWIESLQRDQRWCQGNIQHFWFLGANELNFQSKISILLGIFSYLSSAFWLIFIGLSAYLYLSDLRFFRLAFSSESFDIIFRQVYLGKAMQLQIITLSLLFFPKFLAFGTEFLRRNTKAKERGQLLFFFLSETIISFLMAPTNMLRHVQFVLYTLIGKKVIWKNQNRNISNGLSWKLSFTSFGFPLLMGCLSAIFLYRLETQLFYWTSPIWFSWILSPLVARLTSLSSFTSRETRDQTESRGMTESEAIQQILMDPLVFGNHLFMMRDRPKETDRTKQSLEKLAEEVLANGIASVSEREIRRLLHSRHGLKHFHSLFWKTNSHSKHSSWNGRSIP
ncbi:glucans biosynthesis glucosyltransferase MdoH [Leptospira ryugenii]|uniref:glucans biosynthesis glucosyltransferase MdoH n=1 Tax=Leptospira ryugenii TaxID=1917863 RepID=UPI000D58CC63|nr:glucans biosynthesis glucosyltransferase MdoH [Leptospira ryugenii]